MRKRCLSMILILVLTFGTCGTALAEDSKRGTGGNLKSYGKIAYQNGSDAVVIDSEDFHMLADRLDMFKQRMADQLQAMHTYFTVGGGISLQTNADVSVVHTRPSDENIVNPLEVNFDTLLEGIAVSQSVSSDVTAYGFPAGTELYKNKNGVLTTDGTEGGAEKISVTAATADNLSAGTAAWVNGSLILGTGEDNKSYLESAHHKKIKISFYIYGSDGHLDGSSALQTLVIGFDENGEAKILSLDTPGTRFRIHDGSETGGVSTHTYKVEKIDDSYST